MDQGLEPYADPRRHVPFSLPILGGERADAKSRAGHLAQPASRKAVLLICGANRIGATFSKGTSPTLPSGSYMPPGIFCGCNAPARHDPPRVGYKDQYSVQQEKEFSSRFYRQRHDAATCTTPAAETKSRRRTDTTAHERVPAKLVRAG